MRSRTQGTTCAAARDLPSKSNSAGTISPRARFTTHDSRFTLVKIYTKTGDQGDTGLFGGGRVQKNHPRVEAYGDVDELNAFIGMARAVEVMPRIDEVLVPLQRDLFAIGALLATPDREKMKKQLEKASIDDRRIAELEHAIDDGDRELEPLKSFIVPGGTPKAAALHVARTVCRRAERRVIALAPTEEIPPIVVVYLNRLSDLLFTLARVANRRAGAGEVTW
jgi:cob(I)alamin adenosyltransferase